MGFGFSEFESNEYEEYDEFDASQDEDEADEESVAFIDWGLVENYEACVKNNLSDAKYFVECIFAFLSEESQRKYRHDLDLTLEEFKGSGLITYLGKFREQFPELFEKFIVSGPVPYLKTFQEQFPELMRYKVNKGNTESDEVVLRIFYSYVTAIFRVSKSLG